MTRSIWKYEITGDTTFNMPAGARVLAVQTQGSGEHVMLWALVEPDAPTVRRRFACFGTGHTLPADLDPSGYAGTFQVGPLVFHVFERPA